jgi:hypothetical protein
MSTPLRACRPHLTAAQGPRVEQRAFLARTRYATARVGENSRAKSENPASRNIPRLRMSRFGQKLTFGEPLLAGSFLNEGV